MRLRLQNSVEASVHIKNQASVPQGISSHLTDYSEKQKRISNYYLMKLKLKRNKIELKNKSFRKTKMPNQLQLVTDKTEIQTKD